MAVKTIKATIQIRRGLEQDFDADQMTAGEWAVSTDTKYVRMCFAPGVVLRMATYEAFEQDMHEIQTILATCQDIQVAVDAMEKLAEQHSKDALDYSSLSKSYAVGTDGEIREDDSTDNAKYYYQQSKRIYDDFESSGSVTGVKGDAEERYRTGNVNITTEDIGLGNVANERQYSASNPQPSVTGSSGSCTGNAATATALTTNAGSATQPVYFSNGKPVACTSYANASVKYADSAGSAVDQTARNNANAALEKNVGLLTYSSNDTFTTFGAQRITKSGKMAFLHMHYKLNYSISANGLIATIPYGFRPYVDFGGISPANILSGSKGTITIGSNGAIQSDSAFSQGDYFLDFAYPVT